MKKKKERSKKQKLLTRIIVLGTLLSLVCFSLFYISKTAILLVKNVVSSQEILIDVDLTYSNTIKNNIVACFNEYVSKNSMIKFNVSDFDNHVRSRFNVIKNIEWDFIKPAVSKLTIVGTKPFCRLNDNFVLADNQTIFDKYFFRKENLDALKRIQLAPEHCDTKVPDEVYSFLQSIPDDYWQTYDVDYAKKYDITLYPKEHGKYKIACIADEKSFFDKTKIEFAQKTDSFATRHWIRHYLVDTRFRNRVIIRPINKKTFERIKNKNRGMG